jgi:hypothetical protein
MRFSKNCEKVSNAEKAEKAPEKATALFKPADDFVTGLEIIDVESPPMWMPKPGWFTS